ncbi:MAG TPA: hypothetical protein VNZ49_16830 [Bacteroidia bacterium]|jgi:hypothetical protein|nr:hypothetical protein [Bacteroidia bacterium]
MAKSFFKTRVLFLLLFLPLFSFSQLKLKNNYGGVLSVGGRSVFSTFNDGVWANMGTGMGGQFMLQFSNRVNTAWFADYITSGIGNYANRTDYHIGWSVMYYLMPSNAEKMPKWQPYVLAGHCFDYSNLKDNSNDANFKERWSSAVQAGFGTHYNFSQRFDASLQAQYMIHLGNDVEANYTNGVTNFTQKGGVNLEGHILISLSVNYKLADLW